MRTISMTFNVPESKHIDVEAFKKQMNAIVNVILSYPSVLKDTPQPSWTEEFRGKWQDENMTAEEFVNEIRARRTSRSTVEL